MIFYPSSMEFDTSSTTPKVKYVWDLTIDKVYRYMNNGYCVFLCGSAFEGDEAVAGFDSQIFSIINVSKEKEKLYSLVWNNKTGSTPTQKTFGENADGKISVSLDCTAAS